MLCLKEQGGCGTYPIRYVSVVKGSPVTDDDFITCRIVCSRVRRGVHCYEVEWQDADSPLSEGQ